MASLGHDELHYVVVLIISLPEIGEWHLTCLRSFYEFNDGCFFPKMKLKCVMLFTANVLYCMDLTWYNRLIQRIKPKNSNEVILTVTFDKQRYTLCEHRPGWIWRKSITTNNIQSRQLIHWGRDKMDNTLQTTFSNAFAWMKIVVFWLKFHWNLFLWAQLTIFKHWFGWWLGAGLMTSHYLNQWWMA